MNLSTQDILYLKNRVAYMRDEQAYKKLFLYYYPSLFRFATSIIKHKQLSEEIVSDVMMKVWHLDNRLSQIDNLQTYLLTAVKNTAFTYLNKTKLPSALIDNNTMDEKSLELNTPEDILITSEVTMAIQSAINQLPTQCQLVFRLIKEESLSHKNVASILGISQNTIETHMRLALKKIKHSLENYLGKKI